MNETQVTMIGNVASPVSYGETGEGVPFANFRMAATERRYDRAKEGWVDGDTHWVTVLAWRSLAANLVSSLNKGDPVVVSGRLKVREWDEGESRRSRIEIDARSVGHDLSRGTSAFRWAVRSRGEPGGGSEATVGEAVPEWITSAVAARRAAATGSAAVGADGPPGGSPTGSAGERAVAGPGGGDRREVLV
ncbi:single-stranded DNA-binding protein [Kitasatospora sp. NPDC054939]